MYTCSKCKGQMVVSNQHALGKCPERAQNQEPQPVLQSAIPNMPDRLEGKIDQLTELMGAAMKRLDKLENPELKPAPPSPIESISNSLQTSVEIDRQLRQQQMSESPKCAFGIHYPSDFGQEAFFDAQGKPTGELTPARRRCLPAPAEIRKIIDDVLTPEFPVDILPDDRSATFMLNIIVPPKYCIRNEYRYGTVKDLRAKVINNFNSSVEVRQYAELVKQKIFREHMSAQLPSPFTVNSMKQPLLA